ncbi:hypothetical protein KSP39_PZI008788 [Platanthera zijinensis]|uniref:RecA-like N-terminal domain-containing protein n=1 Tax=Platanthera zijinensis TaxID=2320716 RepID=A0AAP0G881_9ASPA
MLDATQSSLSGNADSEQMHQHVAVLEAVWRRSGLLGLEEDGVCCWKLVEPEEGAAITCRRYCAYLAVENSVDLSLAEAMGVNTENLLVACPNSAENTLSIVNTLVNSRSVDVIVVDSVAALVPERELLGMIDTECGDLQSRLMTQALRKIQHSLYHSEAIVIFVNQDEMSSQESQSAKTMSPSQGRNDILASVLGQEHPGRVRAGDKFSTITSFFKNDRRSQRTPVAHIEDVETIVQERLRQQQEFWSQKEQAQQEFWSQKEQAQQELLRQKEQAQQAEISTMKNQIEELMCMFSATTGTSVALAVAQPEHESRSHESECVVQIYTKKRNRLEHQTLSDLVYIQYNRRLQARFQERREKGRNYNPLVLDELDWSNEWMVNKPEAVDALVFDDDNLTWNDAERAIEIGARNLRSGAEANLQIMAERDDDLDHFFIFNDDEDIEDNYGQNPSTSNQPSTCNANDNLLDDDSS